MSHNNQPEHVQFTLFVNGQENNSTLAIKNVTEFCQRMLTYNKYSIEIVDVTKNIDKALQAGIVVTPTIKIATSSDTATIFGTLSNTGKLQDFLGISQKETTNGETNL